MSEREFELYLSLLGKLLQLNPRQRDEIAQELRDHLEERLDELTASGLTREQAAEAALEEFGDAAGLAQEFTLVAQLRRRRRMMRWTTGTIAAMTCAILTMAHFWPVEQPAGPLSLSVGNAQEPASGGAAAGGGLVEEALLTQEQPVNVIEQKLSQPLAQVQYTNVPLGELLESLSTELEIDFLIDNAALDNMGTSPETAVTIQLNYGKVSARTLLQLVFEQLGVEFELGYTIRDEIVYVTKKDRTMELRVYNCRDLIADAGRAAPHPQPGGMEGGGVGGGGAQMSGGAGGGFFAVVDDEGAAGAAAGGDASGTPVAQAGGGGMGGMGGMGGGFGGGLGGSMGMHPGGVYGSPGDRLTQVIVETIEPESWQDMGGTGGIQEFGGLLVIKNTQEVHVQVQALLDMLRQASAQPSRGAKTTPDAAGPGSVPGAAPPGNGFGAPAGATGGGGLPGGTQGTGATRY